VKPTDGLNHDGMRDGIVYFFHAPYLDLKHQLTGTHKGAAINKNLQAYLNEFIFRFDHRFR
jgi:hypothetical protein